MIPDKIYIRHYWMPGELDDDWHLKPIEGEDYEEYIRKDALIEWLQQGFDWIKNPVISAQQIIDKLNSM